MKVETKSYINFIKKSSLILLGISILLSFYPLKEFIKSIEKASFFIEVIRHYRYSSDIIFSLINVFLLITIYQAFVSEENKELKKLEFTSKKINEIDTLVSEINNYLKNRTHSSTEIRLAIRRIRYIINFINSNQTLTSSISELKNDFDTLDTDLSDYLVIKDPADETTFNIQRKLNNFSNSLLKVEGEILGFECEN